MPGPMLKASVYEVAGLESLEGVFRQSGPIGWMFTQGNCVQEL